MKLNMNLALFLFLIGILGFILNRKNIILMIISIEIMLLAVTVLILISSYTFDYNIGQNFSIYIISIAGAESVIGLSILVAYYRFTYYLISSCLSRDIKYYFKSINKNSSYLFFNTKLKFNSINKFNSLISSRNYSTTVNCNYSNNDSIKFNINP